MCNKCLPAFQNQSGFAQAHVIKMQQHEGNKKRHSMWWHDPREGASWSLPKVEEYSLAHQVEEQYEKDHNGG